MTRTDIYNMEIALYGAELPRPAYNLRLKGYVLTQSEESAIELREDGGLALREDGGLSLRQNSFDFQHLYTKDGAELTGWFELT